MALCWNCSFFPQVMVVIAHTKFGLNTLKFCGHIGSHTFRHALCWICWCSIQECFGLLKKYLITFWLSFACVPNSIASLQAVTDPRANKNKNKNKKKLLETSHLQCTGSYFFFLRLSLWWEPNQWTFILFPVNWLFLFTTQTEQFV